MKKLRPSDLSKPNIDINKDDYPKIVKFYNLKDQTSKTFSIVPIDKPLFQSSQSVIIFENYESFSTQKKEICFRNSDKVSRRLKLLQPESPYFSISAPHTANGEEMRQSQIAPGMEIYYTVIFNVQEVVDYVCDLFCDTEREQFIVPIRACGTAQRISFPDEIDFGQCPIKTSCRKMLLIQNNGDKTTTFKINSNDCQFKCPTEQITMDPKSSLNVEFSFIPLSSQGIQSEFQVTFLDGKSCFITAFGTGININLSLSVPNLSLDPTYISLSSNNTLTLKNNSNIPITFCWKSFYTVEEEKLEKDRLRKELILMESVEVGKIRNSMYQDSKNIETTELNLAANEASILRKYRNLYNALDNDEMFFIDNIFEISPMHGQVWAYSEVEFVVSFIPDIAAQFNCFAYLDVAGREDRLPLSLNGRGIGPNASLSFDVLDVGDVFINEKREYVLVINNKGDISAQWSLGPCQSTFSKNFVFTPNDGLLLPGTSQEMKIVFESDILGEFSEYFRFILQGNEDMLICQIKGNIIGPTFHFDCSCIDFGTVSYDYLHKKEMRLVNTSKIPMIFNLHIPQDNYSVNKEFSIIPDHGTLSANDCLDIVIEFIPLSTKIYDYSIAVDILGVGNNLLTIPVVAECTVSTIRLNSRELIFDECFLRYPYEKDLCLFNESTLVHTRFEFLAQIPYTKNIFSYDIYPNCGIIEPGKSINVAIKITTIKLGQFKIPIMLTIPGSQEPPTQIMLAFSSVGPRVVSNVPDINLGLVNCLIDHSFKFLLTNTSLIRASLKLFTKLAKTKFQLSIREIILEANCSCDVEIIANLDDSTTICDEIHVIVDEGFNLMIPIVAKGNGTTIHCEDNLNQIDLGVRLTKTSFEKQIMLENRGRRIQVLKFTNKTLMEKSSGVSSNKDTKSKHYLPCFKINPEEITLRPRTTAIFTITGYSNQIGNINEYFTLESKIGKDKKFNIVSDTQVSCCFVNPLLRFSLPDVNFSFKWELGSVCKVLKEIVSLSNETSVLLNFVLSTDEPFTLNSWEYSLQPGQSCDVTIEFNPFYKDSKESHFVKSRLSISYIGHPQIDYINMMGEIVFPNLHFNNKSIMLGNILNDTTKRIKILATNPNSEFPVKCSWSFIDDKLNTNKSVTSIPLSQIFDVVPITSLVFPGQAQEFEFSLFGLPNNKFNGIALCSVEGGPQYTFPLIGEASSASFDIKCTSIEYGDVSISQSKTEIITITNNGNVSFCFTVSQVETSSRCSFTCSPSIGTIEPKATKDISISIFPLHPIALEESICVQVAYFDPVYITCKCNVIFPTLHLNLPRYKKYGPFGEKDSLTAWDNFLDNAVLNLNANGGNENSPDRKALDIELQRMMLHNNVSQSEGMSQNFVISQYIAAFGNIIVGQTKTKRFSITNCSDSTISYSFDRGKMSGFGFTIEPDKILKLEPNEVTDFTVIFSPRLLHKIGSKKVVIPVEIKGLSKIEIILTGNCCIPEIDVSNPSFQFGNVLVGCCKRCFFIMQNTSLVPAIWSLKSQSLKGINVISVVPNEGLLRPKEKVLIYIEFCPSESRSYRGEVELKVESNKTVKIINFTGVGITTPIIFEPSVVDFGIRLPFSIDNSTMNVSMTNNSDETIEVYSLDCDEQYLKEEQILGGINIFDSSGVFKSDVRQVGDGLPIPIIEVYNSLTNKVVENMLDISEEVLFDKVTLNNDTAPRNHSTHQDILIIGPSLIGITTICNNICSQLSLPCRSIDDIIKEVARTDSEFGKSARRILNCSLQRDLVEFERMKNVMFENAEKSKADVIENFNNDKKNKGKEVPSEMLETSEVIAFKQFVVDSECPSCSRLLSYRLSWEDAGYGFIFDNIVSDFFKTEDILHFFEVDLLNVTIICLNFNDEIEYINSLKDLHQLKTTELHRINRKKSEYMSLKKTSKKVQTAHRTSENDLNLYDVSKINESWYQYETGIIDELAVEDVLNLPDAKKVHYLTLLCDQYGRQISEINTLIEKLDNILNPGASSDLLISNVGEYDQLTLTRYRCKRCISFTDFCDTIKKSSFVPYSLDTSIDAEAVSDETKTSEKCIREIFFDRINIKSLTDEILIIVPKLSILPRDRFAIPDPNVLQIYKQNYERRVLKKCNHFKLIPTMNTGDISEFRWIMKPRDIIQLQVHFLSPRVGNFETLFDFEVMTTKDMYSVKCLGKTSLPSINTDYRHVFRKKCKTFSTDKSPPSQSYVIGDKIYSFGPLLTFKKKEWRLSSLEEKNIANLIKTNKDIFQISNNSNHIMNVEFGFIFNVDEMKDVFLTNESAFDLEPLSSKHIEVWAFPRSTICYNNSMIMCICDNPIPILYNVTSWGVETALTIVGPWGKDVKDLEDLITACKDKAMLKELEIKLSKSKEMPTLNFDRNLIGISNQQVIELTNSSLLPIAWDISPLNIDSFVISPSKGIVSANSTTTVIITFTSSQPLIIDEILDMKYSDIEGGLESTDRVKKISIKLLAESYELKAICLNMNGLTETNELNFGHLRIGDCAKQSLQIVNKGKYNIKFKFHFKSARIVDLLNIGVMEGVILPNSSSAEIQFNFCSINELILKKNREIELQLIEPLNEEVVERHDILLSCIVQHSKLSIKSSNGLSFGIFRSGKNSCNKVIELKNDGPFDLTFLICPVLGGKAFIDTIDSDVLLPFACREPSALRKQHLGDSYLDKKNVPASKSKETKIAATGLQDTTASYNPLVYDPENLVLLPFSGKPLTINAFTISQRIGLIKVGQSIYIDVSFDSTGCLGTINEKLDIYITGGSDFRIVSDYNLNAEVYLPGILIDNFNSIFEEQEIISSSSLQSIHEKKKVFFSTVENVLDFGQIMCGQVGGKGVVERIKITNPTKVSVNLNLSITNKNVIADNDTQANKGGKTTSKVIEKQALTIENDIFSVHPRACEIPPNEVSYINIYFNPLEIKSYKASFTALVDSNKDVKSVVEEVGTELSFNLSGVGTLPSIVVHNPKELDSNNDLIIDFGNVFINQPQRRTIVLFNNGTLDSNIHISISGNNLFSLVNEEISFLINPNRSKELEVLFSPIEVKENDGLFNMAACIKVSVFNNPYSYYNINLKGSIKQCDAMITKVIDDNTGITISDFVSDVINLPDINLSHATNSSCILHLSSTSTFVNRYEFILSDTENYEIIPSIGHLIPYRTKDIKIICKTSQPCQLETKLSYKLQRIEYDHALITDDEIWDNSLALMREAKNDDLQIISKSNNEFEDYKAKLEAAKKNPKIVVTKPVKCPITIISNSDGVTIISEQIKEPSYNLLSDSGDVSVSCVCKADFVKFKCNHSGEKIIFNDTFMLQSSKHVLTFYNESNIKLNVNWLLEDMSTNSMSSRSYLKNPPFTIEPSNSEVETMKEKQFSITFSPCECDFFSYLLKGRVYNTLSEYQDLEIILQGNSIRPVCHFDMIESPNYLIQRSSTLINENGILGPIEACNIKVVTLESVGLKNRNSYRLQIINPSNENFDYIFDEVGVPSPFWKCYQKTGVVYGGKRCEITFEYLPESEDISETFFQFRIPKSNINQLFLFAGKVTEPKITLSTSHFDFQSVLINSEGSTVTFALQNDEHIPFNFSFDTSGVSHSYSEPIVKFQPDHGTIPPFGRVTMTLTFTPNEERVYTYMVPCIISRQPRRLQLYIRGEGYALRYMLQAPKDHTDQYYKPELSPKINYIDFGSVQVNDSLSKSISVFNEGSYALDYSWDMTSLDDPFILFDQESLNGKIGKGNMKSFSILFRPNEEYNIKNARIQLTIGGIYIFTFFLRGIAVKPAIYFSFMTYNFGPCFVKDGDFNPSPENASLIVKNNDLIKDASIEILLQKSNSLFVQFSQTVLEPGMSLTVPITFIPREIKDYNFIVVFLINGITKISLTVSGTGIKPIVELIDFNQKIINFGSVNIGETVKKSVGLINKSLKPITIQLVEHSGIDKVSNEARGVSFSPSNEIILLPKKKYIFALKFCPTARQLKFEDDLCINIFGTTVKLLSFTGRAQGIEAVLDTDMLFFGNVVEGFESTKTINLRNTGDIPFSFNWIGSSSLADFSVAPTNGSLQPSTSALFNVKFNPHKEKENTQQNLVLNVVGLANSLQLSCIGSCLPTRQIISSDNLEFRTSVRKSTNKTVKITNTSDTDWEVYPVLKNIYWTCSSLKIPKKEAKELLLVYTPLSMSLNEPHESLLQIPLPDGNTMSYNLIGHSGSPECSGEINIETSAKKPCAFQLSLSNWLNEIQKFTVEITISEQSSSATFLKGPTVVALNPGVSKDIPFSFDAYVEGISRAKITFVNMKSGEYIFFNITAKATIPEVIDIIHIESRIRHGAKSKITIANPLPLSEPVEMGTASNNEWWICDSKFIRLKEVTPFSRNTEASFEIEYRPLVTQLSSEHLLTIFTKNIGIFKYKIITSSSPSLHEKLVLETSFGICLNHTINFRAFNLSKCEYQCSISDSKVFTTPKSISSDQCDWNGKDVQFTMTYDPSDIGEINDCLKLFSPDGGEYIFDIIARCLPPIPQGPFILNGTGTKIDIPFRNCFSSSSSYKCYTDSPNFVLPNPVLSLQPKASGTIAVEFKPIDSNNNNGKLFVESTTSGDTRQWIFYVSGKK